MLLAFQFGVNYGIKNPVDVSRAEHGFIYIIDNVTVRARAYQYQRAFLLTIIKVVGCAVFSLSWDKILAPNWQRIAQWPVTGHTDPAQLFKTGVWVSLYPTPKQFCFCRIFPKFINFSAPLLPQYLMLTVGFYDWDNVAAGLYHEWQKLSDWLQFGNPWCGLIDYVGLIFIIIAIALIYWDFGIRFKKIATGDIDNQFSAMRVSRYGRIFLASLNGFYGAVGYQTMSPPKLPKIGKV